MKGFCRMKRFKITLTENQLRIFRMLIRETGDANSYQLDCGAGKKFEAGYRAVLRDTEKLSTSLEKQIRKQIILLFLLLFLPLKANAQCVQQTFTAGTLPKIPITAGNVFQVSCDYGAPVTKTNGVHVDVNGCHWVSWIGSVANFNCTAGAVAGFFPASCTLYGIAPNNFCPMSNFIGNFQVIPKCPTGPGTCVLLNWDAPVPSDPSVPLQTGYHIWYGTQPGVYTNKITIPSPATYYEVTGLTTNATYYFAVSAFNINGDSTNSNEASAPITVNQLKLLFEKIIRGVKKVWQ